MTDRKNTTIFVVVLMTTVMMTQHNGANAGFVIPPLVPGGYCGTVLDTNTVVDVGIESSATPPSRTFRWVLFSSPTTCSLVASYRTSFYKNSKSKLSFTVENSTCPSSLVLKNVMYNHDTHSLTLSGSWGSNQFTDVKFDHGACVDRSVDPSVGSSFCGWGFNNRQTINLMPNTLQYHWTLRVGDGVDASPPCKLAGYYMVTKKSQHHTDRKSKTSNVIFAPIQEWSTCPTSFTLSDTEGSLIELHHDDKKEGSTTTHKFSMKGTVVMSGNAKHAPFAFSFSPADCFAFVPRPRRYCGSSASGVNVVVSMENNRFQLGLLSKSATCSISGQFYITKPGSSSSEEDETHNVDNDVVFDIIISHSECTDSSTLAFHSMSIAAPGPIAYLQPNVSFNVNGSTEPIVTTTYQSKCPGGGQSLLCATVGDATFAVDTSVNSLGVLARFPHSPAQSSSKCYTDFLYIRQNKNSSNILHAPSSSTCNDVSLDSMKWVQKVNSSWWQSDNLTATLIIDQTQKVATTFSNAHCDTPRLSLCGNIKTIHTQPQMYVIVTSWDRKFVASFLPKDTRTAALFKGCTARGLYNVHGKMLHHILTESDCPDSLKIESLEVNVDDRSSATIRWSAKGMGLDGPQAVSLSKNNCDAFSTTTQKMLMGGSQKYHGTAFGIRTTLEVNEYGGYYLLLDAPHGYNSAMRLQSCSSGGFVFAVEPTDGYEAFTTTNLVFVQTDSFCPSDFTLKLSTTGLSNQASSGSDGDTTLRNLNLEGTFTGGTVSFHLHHNPSGPHGLSSTTIAIIVATCLMCVAVAGFIVFNVRRRRHQRNGSRHRQAVTPSIEVQDQDMEEVREYEYLAPPPFSIAATTACTVDDESMNCNAVDHPK